MRLKITHRTEYSYDVPVQYGLQRLRLVPQSGPTQAVVSWALEIAGAREEVRFADQFGNETRLVSVEGEPHGVSVEAGGIVETFDTSGIVGPHQGFAPLWLFARETALTVAADGIAALADAVAPASEVDRLHALMDAVADKVAYVPGSTHAGTNAEEAIALGKGVCQDQAHVFIAAARRLGYPARYVSGYLLLDGTVDQVASHAWAEAHVEALGWVAFDVANRISPDERYVRLAVGRDYREAMPVSGIRLGQAAEALAVHITVEQ
ncbi:transglutaminase family protein [Kumtagia ephedrae]|jgi:transglutaminase-like putative cysteine protease|uniref:Transglutaminase n=1 Tax=Kumtagia ephedrae TaxID=2116701 RepID=A0A2P7SBX8_9HYPH|nr:transglutaminase family protein [Mesorhizobium ephedrae]PSJ59986.1 transglutaminase [Mesorhizobium ephedrae]